MTTLTDVARIKYLFSKKWSALSNAEKQEFLAGSKGSLNISDLNSIGELISNAFSEYDLGNPTAAFPFDASNPPTEEELNAIIDDIVSIQIKSTKNDVEGTLPTTNFQNLTFENYDKTIKYLTEIPNYISNITIKVNEEYHSFEVYDSGKFERYANVIVENGYLMRSIQEFIVDDYKLKNLDFSGSGIGEGFAATNLEKIDLSNVEYAGGFSNFFNFSNLKEFKFSTYYGKENKAENGSVMMFANCSSLENIQMPIGGLRSIGLGMFRSCTSLTSIIIPDSVTLIDANAFRSCTSLVDFNFSGTKNQWNSISFGQDWNIDLAASVVHCSNGDLSI